MKINWALKEDLCPYQKMYSELKCKERRIPVIKFSKRKWEKPAESTSWDKESWTLNFIIITLYLAYFIYCTVLYYCSNTVCQQPNYHAKYDRTMQTVCVLTVLRKTCGLFLYTCVL
jgi:hypothetical protein